MIRVGLLTSWATQCGVAEYSRHLADAFDRRKHGDVDLWVLASRNDPDRHVPARAGYPAVECFQIGHWRADGVHSLDTDRILGMGLDVLHAQYQSMLLDQDALGDLARRFRGVTAVTFHDNCNRPDFPVDAFALAYTHRQGVGHGQLLPFGVENHPPLVRTFGLGRSRIDVIAQVCADLGYRFESAASPQGPAAGRHWVPQDELHEWLRGADAIVQWYPPCPSAGSSQAARTAIATRRPVAVNDTEWFADLPDNAPNFAKLPDTPEALKEWLARTLGSPYIDERSWDLVADRLTADYRQALEQKAARAAT